MPKIEKATYPYLDLEGQLIFEVVRYEDESGKKTFSQRKPSEDGTGWIWQIGNIKKPLFNLPEVHKTAQEGGIVYVVEGEKDVLALQQEGLVATTSPGGAGRWAKHHTESLKGAKVIIISDRDEPGWAHACTIVNSLKDKKISFKIFSPKAHKDVSEILEDGKELEQSLQEFTEKELYDLAGYKPPSQLSKLISDLSKVKDNAKASIKVSSLVHTYLDNISGISRDKGKVDNWAAFLGDNVSDEYDWIIPNILERQERVIVVAAESVGKTMLARQIALLSAAGIHPFTFQPMKPITTFSVDLENPERIIKRTSKKIFKELNTDHVNAHLMVKPSGLNLLKLEDRATLIEHLEIIQPDLLLLGPLYKSFLDPGNRTSEAVITEVAWFLDEIRTTFNCALWLEHHAPLGENGNRVLRPFGSSVWLRWSEFGITLKVSEQDQNLIHLSHYRGQREARDWPLMCTKNGRFPFTPITEKPKDDRNEWFDTDF